MNLEDGTKIGDHPAVIKAFAALVERMGEDKIVQADGPMMQTPKQIDKEINNLTAPGSAYWDKNHPNHQTAVEEVLAFTGTKIIRIAEIDVNHSTQLTPGIAWDP